MMVLHDSVSQMMRQDQKMIQKCSHMKETILHKTWQGMNLERSITCAFVHARDNLINTKHVDFTDHSFSLIMCPSVGSEWAWTVTTHESKRDWSAFS